MMRFLKRVLLFFCLFSLPLFAEVKGKDKKLLNQILRSIHKQRPLLVAQKKGPRKKIRPCVIKKNCPSLKKKRPGFRKKLGLKKKRPGLRKKLGLKKKRPGLRKKLGLKKKRPGLRKKLGLKKKRPGPRKKLGLKKRDPSSKNKLMRKKEGDLSKKKKVRGPLKKRKDRLPPKVSKQVREMRSDLGNLQGKLKNAQKDGNEQDILLLKKRIKEMRMAMRKLMGSKKRPRLKRPRIIKKKQDK